MDENLRTPKRIKDRPLVVSDEQLRQDTGRQGHLLIRSGHVLCGELVFVSKYNLFLPLVRWFWSIGMVRCVRMPLCRRNRSTATGVDPRALK